jgi:hypothetical protein
MSENLKFGAHGLHLPGRHGSVKLNRAIKQDYPLSGAVKEPPLLIESGVKSECVS